jgi:hypothetical protein
LCRDEPPLEGVDLSFAPEPETACELNIGAAKLNGLFGAVLSAAGGKPASLDTGVFSSESSDADVLFDEELDVVESSSLASSLTFEAVRAVEKLKGFVSVDCDVAKLKGFVAAAPPNAKDFVDEAEKENVDALVTFEVDVSGFADVVEKENGDCLEETEVNEAGWQPVNAKGPLVN